MHETQVLLVEDSDSDVALVRAHLAADIRFSLHHAATLADARSRLSGALACEVVVLDLNLPDSTGLDTFISLRDQFTSIPIVILTGAADEELAVAAVGRGAQDYVPKADLSQQLLVRSLLYALERHARQLAESRSLLMQRDLQVAREIQQHLTPAAPPVAKGFDVAAVCQPAEGCCGDFYDFIEIADGQLDLLIADVSSHGLGPAMIMVGTRRILRHCASRYDDLGEIVTIADRAVGEDTLPEQFVTLFYARLDTAARAMSFVGAGHPSWLIDADGKVTTLEGEGLPLGLQLDSLYSVDDSVVLQTGDLVLFMTDGIWEAMSPDDTLFGRDRVFDLVRHYRHEPASQILSHLLDEVSRFCHPALPSDDVTMILAKVV